MEKVEPFGHLGVYSLTPIFSHTSFPAFISDRDLEAEKTGSAGRSITNSRLEIFTGTTAGSRYRYETARFAPYQAGTSTVCSIGATHATLPSGDGVIRIGVGYRRGGSFENAAFYEYKSDGSYDLVVITNGVERKRTNIPNYSDLVGGTHPDITTDHGVILGVEWMWYAAGPVIFKHWQTIDGVLTEIEDGRWTPVGDHFTTPNLPILCEVDNETTATDARVRIGGRRAGIRGKLQFINRPVPEFRDGVLVGTSGWEPLIAFRAKDTWGGVQNNLVAAVRGFETISTEKAVFGIWDVPRGTLSGTWGPPNNVTDDEQGFEVNTSPGGDPTVGVARSGFTITLGSSSGGGSSSSTLPGPTEKDERIQVIRDRELVLAINNLSGSTSTVDALMDMAEEGR